MLGFRNKIKNHKRFLTINNLNKSKYKTIFVNNFKLLFYAFTLNYN